MSGIEALDLALGLLRAPARRELLAARPLPAGMTTLLEVAGGSSSAARAAAAHTGATADELLEAARFFVQQVQFSPHADAYRVLGATASAPQDQLHTHHRLLQRWLHPDRDGGEAWDSAFSARVNEAWSRVRTPHARQAYDQELATRCHAPAATATPTGSWRTPASLVPAGESSPPPRTARSNLGPLAVIAAVLICIALAWLVQQRDLRAQAQVFPPRPAPVAAPSPPATAAVEAPIATTAAPVSAVADERGDAHITERRGRSPDLQEPAGVTAAAPPSVNTAPSSPVGRPYAADASDNRIHGERGDAHITGRRGRSPDLQPPATATTTIETATTTTTPEDPLQLLQQAEHAATQATTYLLSDGSHIPPIWNDFSTEAAAAQSRTRLHQRLDNRRTSASAIDLTSPHWRMDSERATLDAGYRIGGWRTREQGRLRVELSRREQRWLVTRLQLEPTP